MTRQDALLIKADVRAEIIAFAGEPQYFFLGLVSRSWRGWFEGKKKNTADSQIVTSVPRAMAALGSGWAAGNGAWKCAATLGGMEVLDLLLEMYDPRDGA